jgi:1,4-dihydroxy-2-naphthoate octaprenyltransferase
MDLDIDRHEKSKETGRDRPLVFGWATVGQYRLLSAVVTVILIILAAYLTLQRIYIPLLFLIGFIFDYGYNHPRFALAYRPFTEWYIFPWLVVGVTVTVVYAATGIFSWLAFIISMLHGLVVTCFVVSMMRRDVNSDRRGNKFTSSVIYPTLPHATIFGVITLVASVLMYYPLARVIGNPGLAAALVITTAVIAGTNVFLGARVDRLSNRNLHAVFPDFEKETHLLVLKQVGVSMAYAVAITVIFLVLGGIV